MQTNTYIFRVINKWVLSILGIIIANMAFASQATSGATGVYSFCLNKSGQPFSCFIRQTIYDKDNNHYIAVGASSEYGTDGEALVLTSKNGINDWQVAHNAAASFPELNSIIKAGSKYFAVGTQGAVLSSIDGVNYQKITVPDVLSSINFVNVAYNTQSQIIAMGNDMNAGQLYSALSNDNGTTWQLNQINTNSNNRYTLVVNTIWDNQLNQYVSIANSLNPDDKQDPGKHASLISKDGIHWTIHAMDGANYGGFEGHTLTKYQDMYLAGGVSMAPDDSVFANLMWSRDGANWNSTTDTSITSIDGMLSAIATNGSDVILVIKDYNGDQANLKLTILKSTNGLSNYQIVSHQFYESMKTCTYDAIWANNNFLITGMLDSLSVFKEQILYSDQSAGNWYSPLTQARP